MRGRHAIGPEIAERVEGSALARTRMRVILETITNTKPVKDACAELDICGQMFERYRARAIEAAVASLELKPAGRPAKAASPDDEQIAELKERIAELEAELQAATLKAELAATLPRLASSAGKKP
jgi:hypothetical protein